MLTIFLVCVCVRVFLMEFFGIAEFCFGKPVPCQFHCAWQRNWPEPGDTVITIGIIPSRAVCTFCFSRCCCKPWTRNYARMRITGAGWYVVLRLTDLLIKNASVTFQGPSVRLICSRFNIVCLVHRPTLQTRPWSSTEISASSTMQEMWCKLTQLEEVAWSSGQSAGLETRKSRVRVQLSALPEFGAR